MPEETCRVIAREVANFRDFGGVASNLGGRVRRGLLFRCGHLHGLSSEATTKLRTMNFGVIADLRYESERFSQPSGWPTAYADRIHFHGGERTAMAPHLTPIVRARAGGAGVRDFYLDYYAELPFHPLYRPLFAQVIRALGDTDAPTLIHCTAGKDRTGTLVALIHEILGVSREAIVADYLRSAGDTKLSVLSATRVRAQMPNLPEQKIQEMVALLMGVEPDYILAAFASIERRAGTVEQYFDEMGIDTAVRASIHDRLLSD